ncbi:glycosyltransferase family 2 protein [Clostridium sp. JS66]|uniref:glycosyltransferase family 2 protein n=1 Tax=Clostridium sp. JS66 TaxID=3064705 RepID=UPI00298E788F|nr:glycosyltransferase family 2 protein [Clostridium sp. JS66]WPC41061.1 glycosyltransferase family 2 protein [Clostridium sp. JS66]
MNKEFTKYDIQIRNEIQSLINSSKLDEALKLTVKYENIVGKNSEIYSFKSIIAIMKNNLFEAEKLLEEGLNENGDNFDLLYNRAYLYQRCNEKYPALIYYKWSLERTNDEEMKEQIKNIISELENELMENKDYKNKVKKSEVRFSVVIPTRQGHEVLKYAIQTCINQDFDSYEIIVCDNFSSRETKEVVDSFNCKRIKYIRSTKPLSMSDNWELAVSYAKGEYIIAIGDDDGLLLHALKEIDKIIKRTSTKAVKWDQVSYFWSSSSFNNKKDILSIPFSKVLFEQNAIDVLNDVINIRANYSDLPMIYNSAIHRDLLGLLIYKTGRVFKSAVLDAYSGFTFGYLVKKFISTKVPMSIAGVSGKSNGVACVHSTESNTIAKEFIQLNNESGLTLNVKVPNLYSFLTACYLGSFFDARDNLFPKDEMIIFDPKKHIIAYMNELIGKTCKMKDESLRKSNWEEGLKIIRNLVIEDKELLAWFDDQYYNYAEEFFKTNIKLKEDEVEVTGFNNMCLTLDTKEFCVKNVYEAAELCEKILGYKKYGIDWLE